MGPQDPVVSAGHKIQQVWLQDGIAEIVMGVVMLVPAAQIGLGQWAQPGPARNAAMMALILAFATSGIWAKWLITHFRNRWIGSRAGYWIPRPEFRFKRIVSGLVVAAIVGAIATVYARTGTIPGWFMVGLTGVAGAQLLAMTAHSSGVRRLWLLAVLCAAGGLLAAYAAPDMNTGFIWLFGGMAAVTFGSGLWALRCFLRRTG